MFEKLEEIINVKTDDKSSLQTMGNGENPKKGKKMPVISG